MQAMVAIVYDLDLGNDIYQDIFTHDIRAQVLESLFEIP